MHAIGNDFLRKRGVLGVRLLEHGDHGRIQIRGIEMLATRQILHELGIAQQNGVITTLDGRLTRNVVEGRRLNGRDTKFRECCLHIVNDLLVARGIVTKYRLIVGAIACVVHAEHDGHDRGTVGDDVAA